PRARRGGWEYLGRRGTWGVAPRGRRQVSSGVALEGWHVDRADLTNRRGVALARVARDAHARGRAARIHAAARRPADVPEAAAGAHARDAHAAAAVEPQAARGAAGGHAPATAADGQGHRSRLPRAPLRAAQPRRPARARR